MKIIMTKGLIGCGKTTWSKEQQTKDPSIVRLNKDELRAMMHDSRHNKSNESQVIRIETAIIEDALKQGRTVIVDNTHGHPSHQERFEKLAKEYNTTLEIQEFDVPLATCIERDSEREKPIGKSAIMKMYNQFFKKNERKLDPMVFDDSLPYCVIFDIDGTLAHIIDRSPYDGKSCWSDEVNESIKLLNHMVGWYNKKYMSQHKWDIVLFSGRSGESEPETRKWLEDKNIDFQELHMRKPGDFRKDSIVKEEMFNEFIRDKYNVVFIVDDRKQVVDMWRSLGLTCLQVAPGEF